MPRPARSVLVVLATALVGSAGIATPAFAAPAAAAAPVADELLSVSCARVTACVAVGGRVHGQAQDQSISYVWNGKAWRFHPMAGVSHARFQSAQAVDCLTAVSCLAVGDATTVAGSTFTQHPVAQHWNGRKWQLLHLGLPAGAQLSGVACAGRVCMIVGSGPAKGGAVRALAVKISGGRRVVTELPLPAHRNGAAFSAVSCSSSRSCTAVGAASPGPPGNSATDMAARWTGGRWRLLRIPQPKGLARLLSVSCTAATQCMAAGWPVAGIATKLFPLTLRENAGRWTTVPVAGSARPNYEPQAVSCAAPKQCLTAGFSNLSAASRPGAAIWNGRTMRFGLVPGAASGELFGISCPAVSRCMAVGFTKVSKADPAGGLAEFWTGRRWKLLPLPAR